MRQNGHLMKMVLRGLAALVLAVSTAGAITRRSPQSDSGAGREARPGVEIRDVVRLPETRGLRPADQDVVPAGWARVSYRPRSSGRPPVRQRLARVPVPARSQQPAVGVCERRRRLPVRRLQPAGERVHRIRLSPGVRAERVVLHRARRARDGQSRDAELHPAGVHGGGRDLPQHHHRVARHQPRGEHLRGHQARTAPRRAHRHEPDASVRPCRVQPDGEAGLARLRPALHERQRPGIQQRRRTAREQSRPDAAPRHGHRRDPADRPAQPVGVEGDERDSATTRFRRSTSSPRTAIRRRSARSTPTASGTPTGCPGISPMGRCSRRTSG